MEKECNDCGYMLKNHKFKNDKYHCPEIGITMNKNPQEREEVSECCGAEKFPIREHAFSTDYCCSKCAKLFIPKPEELNKCECGCNDTNKNFPPDKIWDKKCIYYSPQVTPSTDSWAIDFDKKFIVLSNANTPLLRYTDANLIKSFIKDLLETAKREEREHWKNVASRLAELGYENTEDKYHLGVKHGLDSSLDAYKKKLCEEIEKMKKEMAEIPPHKCGSEGYCEHYPVLDVRLKALEDVKSLLQIKK